jgi:ABC-type glycerol-3-phosphate transport system substrate-binding protein
MSTELMGGRGSDLMAMDVLPWTKYAEGGQLENLRSYMEADSAFNLDDYKRNLWDALKFKGGQYLVSLDYDFQYMAYDSSLFNEEELQALNAQAPAYLSLLEFAKPAYERDVAANKDKASKIIGYSPQDLLNEIFKQDYSDFLDIENRTGSFTDGKFQSLLETVKDYGDKGYLKSDTSEGKYEEEQSRFFFKSNTQFAMLLNALSTPSRRIMVSTGGDLGDTDDDKVMGPVTSKGGKVGFTYSQAYGLNVNSGNKPLAWAFLKYLLSEAAQTNVQLSSTGLPINNAARAKRGDMALSQFLPEGPTEEQLQKLAIYMSDIERFSDMLNYYPIPDETVNGIIKVETANFMNGSISAEEAASTTQSKVELYLNE